MPIKLAEYRVEIRATDDGVPIAQSGIAEFRSSHYKYHRRRRRQIMRDQLLQKIVRELGKFVLDLKLNARRKKGRAFQKAADQWIDAIFQYPAQSLGDTRIFVCEFARLLVEQLEY